jgi:hypothetical protein
MKTYERSSLSTVGEFFRDILGLFQETISPRQLLRTRIAAQTGLANGVDRSHSSSRRAGWFMILVGLVLLAGGPAWAGQPSLPAGVPNIYDPEVRAQFQLLGVANLRDNPDFPVVLLGNTASEEPTAILLGLDARNGKETWSLMSDPVILIVVFSDETTIQDLFVDMGFADQGKASGKFGAVDAMNRPALPDLLKAITATAMQTNI